MQLMQKNARKLRSGKSVPFILGELRNNTASVGQRKNYPWYMVHGTLHIFFSNKTFLFVKIESWHFQHLFDIEFRESLQNFSSFRQILRPHFSTGIKVVRMSWNFVRFHKEQNLIDAKSFIPKKILSVPCTMDSSFFS